MSSFSEAFAAGAGFSPESLRYLYQGVLGIVVLAWGGMLVKGFIRKAHSDDNPSEYFIQHIAVLFVVIVAFIALSYW